MNNYFKLIECCKDIIKDIYEDPRYNDEPKIYSFSAKLKNKENAGGASLISKKKALMRTLGESIERHNLGIYKQKRIIYKCYEDLRNEAVNPENFVHFSENRSNLKVRPYTSQKDKINWIRGISLTQHKKIFIPAQVVFVPYNNFNAKEPIINLPISTGAATFTSLKKTLLRGLLEVCERDSFMISYLNKLTRNIIDISRSNDKEFAEINSIIKRYNLELYIIDISSEVPIYSILSILIDRTGLGPAVSLGMKANLRIKKAILGAFEESVHSRTWFREEMIRRAEAVKKTSNKPRKELIRGLAERGMFWSDIDKVDKISFFLEGKKISIEKLPKKKKNDSSSLLSWFRKNKLDVLAVNLTPPSQKKKNIYTVKTIIPKFQPLYLDERFPSWQGKRLRKVPLLLKLKPLKEPYKFPHPFL